VFAVAAVATTSALALPEFGKCEAKAGGKYSDPNCTVKAKGGTGSYEWKKGSQLKPIHFEGGNVGSGGVLSTLARKCEGEGGEYYGRVTRKKCEELGEKEVKETEPLLVECESERNTGEISGSKSIVNISVVFRGCKLFGAVPCSNGTSEGEIQVNQLKGELGYISKSEKKVGVLLEPVVKHGEFAKFDCGGLLETVVGVGSSKEGAWYIPESKGGYDGIISPITPVNTMTSEYTQVYTVNSLAENIPSSFEGKHIDLLEAYVYSPESPQSSTEWQPAGEEVTNVNYSTEAGEIKA
jgi:hypothetical protein